ncbi:uncharacterized protein LOC131884559 isoform X2 [Tigriopus californicus]|uniref:uncharacterized protein LOC131884559 isoform X2 n=1 Tax=Tigriopus californicus TaxID=6832 RepID=UPI0027DA1659|nr:uncharacterized protein LOC131884559 isoform X2 [Tigriopus californicus]
MEAMARLLGEFLTLFVSILGLCQWSWNHLGLGLWYSTCSTAMIARFLSLTFVKARTATELNYMYLWYIEQLECWSLWALGTLGPLCLALQFSSTWWVRLLLVWMGLFLLGTKLNDEFHEELWISEEHFFASAHLACMTMLCAPRTMAKSPHP